jgi:hypothetical protein
LSPRNEAAKAIKDGSRIGFSLNCSQEVTLMETPKAPETASGETTLIGTSIMIKGELSCGEDLYIDGQVEGTIDPKGNRLTIGPQGALKPTSTPPLWSSRVSWRVVFKRATGSI